MKYFMLAVLFGSCTLFKQYPDNPIEEKLEDMISSDFGIDVELSPENESKERIKS